MNSRDNSILDELIGGLCIWILTLISDHLSHVFFSSLIFQFVFKRHTFSIIYCIQILFDFWSKQFMETKNALFAYALFDLVLQIFWNWRMLFNSLFFFNLWSGRTFCCDTAFKAVLSMSIISGGKCSACSIQSSSLKFLSFCYFANCNYLVLAGP